MASLVERPDPVSQALQGPQQGLSSMSPPGLGTANAREPVPWVQAPQAPQQSFSPQEQAAQQAWLASLQNMPRHGPGQMPGAQLLPNWQAPTSPPTMLNPAVAGLAMRGIPAYQQPPPMMGRAPVPMPPGGGGGIPAYQQPQPIMAPLQASAMQRPGMQGMQGGMMSDATHKVTSMHSIADDFLDKLKPYTYKYKSPGDEPRAAPTGGDYLGVMAQDVERVPEIGHQLILDTPQGKMIDKGVALSALLGAAGRLNERVRALEADAMKRGR